MTPNFRDPEDPIVKAALSRKCECGAGVGETCASITKKPFADKRLVHFARIMKWDVP